MGHDWISETGLAGYQSYGVIECPGCGAEVPGAYLSTVPQGRIVLRAALPQPIAAALLLAGTLSPRERAAFELLGLGYDNRSIARTLQISERTAKRHITAILKKLKLESRLQAGLTAIILYSVSPGPSATAVAQKSHGRAADTA